MSHPLLVDVIVENILNNVSDEELGTCRLVCSLWNGIGKRVREKRHRVVLSHENEIRDLIQKLKTYPDYRVFDLYVHKLLNLDGRFKKLLPKILPTLSSLSLQDNKIPSLESYYNLMLKICPTLNRLDLGTVKTPRGAYLKYFPIPNPQNGGQPMVFPKMKHFEYISYNDEVEEATCLSDVLKAFPNLRKLVIAEFYIEKRDNLKGIRMPDLKTLSIRMLPQMENGARNSYYGNFAFRLQNCACCFMERMRGIERSGGCQLQHQMQQTGGFKTGHIEILLELDLHLEYLKIININRNIDLDLFKKFILLQSDTLEDLYFSQLMDDRSNIQLCKIPAQSPFPVDLPHLKRLSISRPFVKNLNHILNSCPNLQEIAFDFYENADWSNILTSKVTSHKKVIYLTVTSIDPKALGKIAEMFPSLEGLEVRECNDDLLRIIFEKITKIKKLVLRDGVDRRMSSEGFTGMNKETLKRLKNCDDDVSKMSIEEIEGLRNGSFVGNLTDLTILYLGFENFRPLKSMITWGLSYLPSLTILVVRGIEKMTVDYKKFMEEEGFMFVDSKHEHGSMFLKYPESVEQELSAYLTISEDYQNP